MQVGIIADIHGNLFALDAVLAALDRDGVDEIICLGDVAVLGPEPAAVVARLRALGCPVVMGNVDAWLLDGLPGGETGAHIRTLYAWCAARLSADDLAFVRTFAPVVARSYGGTTLLCFHGSPRSANDVIVATTPEDDLDAMCAGHRAALLIGGHTHIAMLRRYRDARLLNPGSVGLPGVGAALPPNRDVHWGEYAVLDLDGDHVGVTLRRVPLDVRAMTVIAERCGMPARAWWATRWRHHGQ